MNVTEEKYQFEKPLEVFQLWNQREYLNFKELNKIAVLALTIENLDPMSIKFMNSMLEE